MRISDWSSDVCSSDLAPLAQEAAAISIGWRKASNASGTARRDRPFRADTSVGTFRAGSRSPYRRNSLRSEERRVRIECVSTCRSRRSPDHAKKKKIRHTTKIMLDHHYQTQIKT